MRSRRALRFKWETMRGLRVWITATLKGESLEESVKAPFTFSVWKPYLSWQSCVRSRGFGVDSSLRPQVQHIWKYLHFLTRAKKSFGSIPTPLANLFFPWFFIFFICQVHGITPIHSYKNHWSSSRLIGVFRWSKLEKRKDTHGLEKEENQSGSNEWKFHLQKWPSQA